MNSKDPQGVNRALQIGKIRKILSSLRLKFDEPHSIVYNLFGIPGIGKTTLGLMIGDLCSAMDTPFVLIDFNPEKNQRAFKYKDDYILILEDICTALKEDCPKKFYNILESYKIKDKDLKQKHTQDIIHSFHDYIKKLLAEKPLVILFDTTEKADRKVIQWVEDNIVSWLCITGNCLIIWTGRFEQRWKLFEVRRRTQTEKLESLDAQSSYEQIRGYEQAEDHSSLIYHLTFGYPLGNVELAKVINQHDTEEPNERYLIQKLAENVIDSYVLKDIPEDLKVACRIMSVVRQFDVMILERLLCEFAGNFFNENTAFMNVIGRLAATAIIEWNPIRKGFALDETIRRIMMLHMKLNSPDTYLKIARKAAGIYEEWIGQNRENRSIYIKEKIFHLINIGICENILLPKILEDCENALKIYLQTYYKDEPFSQTAAIQLYEEFSNDKELQEIAGKENIEKLLEVIESHRKM